MASCFLLVFLLCITMASGFIFPLFHRVIIHRPAQVHRHVHHHTYHHVHHHYHHNIHRRSSYHWGSCPHGWTKYGSRCFLVQTSHQTAADAERTCVALGGNLASIHNHGENVFVRNLIYRTCHSYAKAWVGMYDAIQEGKWLWTDGSKVRFTAWSHGEPNNQHQEHCTEVNWRRGPYWNDVSCHVRRPFVCARKLSCR